MRSKVLLTWLWVLSGYLIMLPVYGQHNLTIHVSFSAEVADELKDNGRLLLFLNENPNVEPRTRYWPTRGNHIFAVNLDSVAVGDPIVLDAGLNWVSTADWMPDDIPEGTYNIQVLWHQQFEESRIVAPGNIYSRRELVRIEGDVHLDLVLDQIIPPRQVMEHSHVKEFRIISDTLSAWWGKPVELIASVLLPHGYFDQPGTAWPIRYNVSGYGGRYIRVNFLSRDQEFYNWWFSDKAPGVINVFLDGEGPFGDSYQLDSENSGPYGYALIHELIPALERAYRNTDDARTRFVDGCSTGGWVSLALQMFYPDHFNGVFSYSPDAVEFTNYQLINIYEDDNAYYNKYGYLRPVSREITGQPVMSLREFIRYENVLGTSNTYLNSGGQFSAHTALYSPHRSEGLPAPLFDPFTGTIDREVAEAWKKYDLLIHARENWLTLGPKLSGKIYIWMGDMDQYYLNMATRTFHAFLKSTTDPVSDAIVEFTPMEGHCTRFNHRRVLDQIAERLVQLETETQ